MKRDKVIYDSETGEVLSDLNVNVNFSLGGYKKFNEAVIDDFKKHKRYEYNTKASKCDGIAPMSIKELYEYFVSQGHLLYSNSLTQEEFEKNEKEIEDDEAINQYEAVDDLVEKINNLDKINSFQEDNKEKISKSIEGGVKQSETTTTIETIDNSKKDIEKKE